MSILEEHNYGIKIEKEVDNPKSLQDSELNIKMECDQRFDTEDESEKHSDSYNTNKVFRDTKFPSSGMHFLPQNKRLKSESSDDDDDDDDDDGLSELGATDLKKACILQTCLSLLDSSSSDEDELILLWLLCRNQKKKLTKRRRL